jgi:integrase
VVKRERILDDDELRAVWRTAEADGTYGALIRLLLLTGQRREKVAAMRWEDLDGATWTIPAETREKGNAGQLVLPELALEIINTQPRYASNPYVFAGVGAAHIEGWTRRKLRFDAKLEGVKPWVLHDLRRTARSLLSRAGVRPDISERVLGHVIRGVEGVYDRHSYAEEKAHALKALAALIENILRPSGTKVVRMRG